MSYSDERAFKNRKHNSHSHVSNTAYDHRFWGHSNMFVRSTRTSLVFLKIFIKNSVKIRHSQHVFEEILLQRKKIGSEEIFTTTRKGHWEGKKREVWLRVLYLSSPVSRCKYEKQTARSYKIIRIKKWKWEWPRCRQLAVDHKEKTIKISCDLMITV